LIEVMVVLAIAAVVTSITVSGFRSLTDGNRRTTCQTNMSQIYASLRLYAADNANQVPYYNPRGTTGEKSIGLWALYAFPRTSDNDNIAPKTENKPVDLYLRSAKVLHCPADLDVKSASAIQSTVPVFQPDDPTQYNRGYLSYQTFDNGTPDDDTDDVYLYDPMRTPTQGASGFNAA
jgi:type II secretory pathway pseudopilin PulG